MKMKNVVPVLCLVALCGAQNTKRQKLEWGDRLNAQKTDTKHCSNLTLVLDNWRFAIVNQVKDLLLHETTTVLPEYGRIQPLSDALGSLHKEFKALKENLVKLTNKLDKVEAVVDDIQAGNAPWASRVTRPVPLRIRGGAFINTPPVDWQGHSSRLPTQNIRRLKNPQD
uniref:Si:dkey-282h22.5 n=1 Tax=Paramormyrops kingsleyae TaxID=1676925 RepID=A0A3B3RUY7_9TELE